MLAEIRHIVVLLMGLVLLALGVSACAGTGTVTTLAKPPVQICSSQADKPLPPPAFEIERDRSDIHRATRDSITTYSGPLIDVHVHMDPPGRNADIDFQQLQEIVSTLQANGIEIAVFMPTPNDGRFGGHLLGATQRLALKNIAPDAIRLFAGSNYITYWLHKVCHDEPVSIDLREVVAQLSEDLSSADYIGVGEIGILHFKKKKNQHLIAIQPNFGPFLAIVEEIVEHDVWLDLHIEPVDPDGLSYEHWAFGGLELLFDQNPTLRVILSHTAMTSPTNARRILETYPNVMLSIKVVTPTAVWKNLEPVFNSNGEVYEDWATLFEEMPNRFVIGSDAKFMRRGFTLDIYEEMINMVRRLLGSLSPAAARAIAYDNAKIMFP